MANINQQWKKFMAVGCNHGYWADPTALDAVLKFKERYRPDTAIHLGDYMDVTSFRGGASESDKNTNLREDIEKGTLFIRQYQPTLLFNGNHDIRLWDKLTHHNAIIAQAAQSVVEDILESIPPKCEFVSTYNVFDSYRTLGDTKFLHGIMYNESAMRDHAEQFGKCVIAHLHKVGSMPGRNVYSPRCYCVGYLGDRDKFKYAERRRATSQWSQGFAWGEYTDSECRVRLEERNQEGEWKLPY
jgi:hypothetical protein